MTQFNITSKSIDTKNRRQFVQFSTLVSFAANDKCMCQIRFRAVSALQLACVAGVEGEGKAINERTKCASVREGDGRGRLQGCYRALRKIP